MSRTSGYHSEILKRAGSRSASHAPLVGDFHVPSSVWVSGWLRSDDTSESVHCEEKGKVDCDQSHCDLQVIGLLLNVYIM